MSSILKDQTKVRTMSIFDSRRRDKLEIIYQVLKNLQEKPLRITHIIHRVNLDTRTAQSILKLLVDKGLVEIIDQNGKIRLYKITRKGIEFVKKYEELTNLLLT